VTVTSAAAAAHPVLRGVPSGFVLSTYVFISPSGPSTGATVLSTLDAYSGECCTTTSSCNLVLTPKLANQGILVQQYGLGRIVWLAMPYCGYSLYQPHNLRTLGTPEDALFTNALAWASGKCAALNDCGAHGVCSGANKCRCDDGWWGNANCTARESPSPSPSISPLGFPLSISLTTGSKRLEL
jgi:hypothetical protein